MTRKLVTAAVTAVAALLLSGTFDSADAKKGWSGSGSMSYSGGGKVYGGYGGKVYGGYYAPKYAKFHHGHKFRKRHIFIGAPVVYGAYAYSDSCYWLRRRAIYTGSPYWWNRYYDCLYGYGYY